MTAEKPWVNPFPLPELIHRPNAAQEFRDAMFAPAPSGVDDLRDRIATAIDEAGTGETTYTREYGMVAIAADPGDVADAVLEVVGPELARRDAENARLAAELAAVEQTADDDRQYANHRIAELRAERDQLRNDVAELYTANGKLLDAVRREADQLTAEIGAFVGRLRRALDAAATEVPAERGETT